MYITDNKKEYLNLNEVRKNCIIIIQYKNIVLFIKNLYFINSYCFVIMYK